MQREIQLFRCLKIIFMFSVALTQVCLVVRYIYILSHIRWYLLVPLCFFGTIILGCLTYAIRYEFLKDRIWHKVWIYRMFRLFVCLCFLYLFTLSALQIFIYRYVNQRVQRIRGSLISLDIVDIISNYFVIVLFHIILFRPSLIQIRQANIEDRQIVSTVPENTECANSPPPYSRRGRALPTKDGYDFRARLSMLFIVVYFCASIIVFVFMAITPVS